MLRLQVHVHHELLPLYLRIKRTVEVGVLVIHLDVLHRVVRQVLHQHLRVAAHERARAELQLVNLPAINKNLAIFIDGHARHLVDEVVKHRAVGQFERRGIIDDGVAPIVHLHLRGRHCHLLQVHLSNLAQFQRIVEHDGTFVTGIYRQGQVAVLITFERTP